MTNITFKNGLPLLLQPAPGSDIGLVAADSGCCCPPPPPERCWNCLGSCAYFIEIEVPQGVSAKSAANFCEGPSGSVTNQSVFLYPDQAPGTLTFKFTTAQAYNSGGSSGEILSASVFSVGEVDDAAFCEFSGYGSTPATLVSNVLLNVSVVCREVESGSPFFVRISGYITVGIQYQFIIGTEGQCASGWQWYFEGEYQIPSECVVSPSQQCDGYDGEFRQITTPLTFTIDGTTCSLGAFSSSTVSTQYESAQTFELVESVGEDLRDAFTATISITARENCLPPENVCCCEGISGISEIDPDEECEGDVLTKPGEPTDIDTMTVVVEWDGLTAELNSGNGFNSGVVSEGIDTFTCVQPGPFPIEADLRQITFASVSASSNICNLWRFSGSLQLLFEGVGPFGGPVGSGINLDIFVSECHDGYVSPFPAPGTHPSWCPNDYAEPVVTLVIAP